MRKFSGPDALETARKEAGLSVEELWLRYFEMTGSASPIELEGFLYGALVAEAFEYDLIVHALNERFFELGKDHPVPYKMLR